MSKRSTDYLNKPDINWLELKNQLNTTTFYLLARPGPTVFSIKDDISNSKPYRVTLGNPHICSCQLNKSKYTRGSIHIRSSNYSSTPPIINEASLTENNLNNNNNNTTSSEIKPFMSNSTCIHIMYCILKVLRIPDTHSLSYQTSYTENEIEQVLSGKFTVQPTKIIEKQTENNQAIKNENDYVDRQILTSDNEICPICQDFMIPEKLTDDNIDGKTDSTKSSPIPLTWCRKGCGNNIHAKCMYSYSQYKISNKLDVTCPLCRENWLLEFLKKDCQVDKYLNNKLHKVCTVKCNSCLITVKNNFYRCIECSRHSITNASDEVTNTQKNLTLLSIDKTKNLTKLPVDKVIDKSKDMIDFCQRCFSINISKKHKNHHFLSSNISISISDINLWSVIANPLNQLNTISNDSMNQLTNILRHRELTSEDYNILLSLDNTSNNISISNHIIDSYKLQSYGQCWCHSNNNDNDVKNMFIDLSCNHSVHKQCLLDEMNKADDMMLLYDTITCKHIGCNKKIFYYLNRIKSAKPKIISPNTSNPLPNISNNLNEANVLPNNNFGLNLMYGQNPYYNSNLDLPPISSNSVVMYQRNNSNKSNSKRFNGLIASGHLLPLNTNRFNSNESCNLELSFINRIDNTIENTFDSKLDNKIERKIEKVNKKKDRRVNVSHTLTPIDMTNLSINSINYTNNVDVINNIVDIPNKKQHLRLKPNILSNSLSKLSRSQSLDNNNLLLIHKIKKNFKNVVNDNMNNDYNMNNINDVQTTIKDIED